MGGAGKFTLQTTVHMWMGRLHGNILQSTSAGVIQARVKGGKELGVIYKAGNNVLNYLRGLHFMPILLSLE